MNTNKVRNMVIVFLLALNAMLLGFTLVQDSKFMLTHEQETAVLNLLQKSDIQISAKLIKSFGPKKTLAMDKFSYDHEKMAQGFFPESVSGLKSDNTTIYTANQASLVFSSDNSFTYSNEIGYKNSDFADKGFSEETAKELAVECMKKVVPAKIAIELFAVTENSGYYTFDFRGKYNGYGVYSNFVRIKAGPEGVIQIKGSYSQALGFTGNSFDIHSPDEALIAAMYQLKFLYGDAEINIARMEIVYYIADSNEGTSTKRAEPCYLFGAVINGVNVNILVNAYTNVVLK